MGGIWVLTVWDPLTPPCHTDPVEFWPGRTAPQMPQTENQQQRLWLCQLPVAQTRIPRSVLLCTTSSLQHDIWGQKMSFYKTM